MITLNKSLSIEIQSITFWRHNTFSRILESFSHSECSKTSRFKRRKWYRSTRYWVSCIIYRKWYSLKQIRCPNVPYSAATHCEYNRCDISTRNWYTHPHVHKFGTLLPTFIRATDWTGENLHAMARNKFEYESEQTTRGSKRSGGLLWHHMGSHYKWIIFNGPNWCEADIVFSYIAEFVSGGTA